MGIFRRHHQLTELDVSMLVVDYVGRHISEIKQIASSYTDKALSPTDFSSIDRLVEARILENEHIKTEDEINNFICQNINTIVDSYYKETYLHSDYNTILHILQTLPESIKARDKETIVKVVAELSGVKL